MLFMKKFFFLTVLICFFNAAFTQDVLRVMTFNIRLNIASDSLDAWPYRKDNLASQVLFHKVHVLGVQEALHDQMMDLQQRLPHFKYTGEGRDGGTKGEYSAIFYDSSRLTLLQSSTFWLSEKETVSGSKGWDAAYPRIVTWAKFRDNKTRKVFFAFNTHFDHMGKMARKESALMLLSKIKLIAGNAPSVITGDFNAEPSDEPVQIITDVKNPLHLINSSTVSKTPHYGPTGTFNAFKNSERSNQPIDYIFLKGKWHVFTHATISQTWNGRFASDHFSVIAEILPD